MFRIAICDDETKVCSGIEQMIINYSKRCIETIDVEVFFSGEELCDFMKKGKQFDLIFLDILMQKKNGVETAKYIRNVIKDEHVQIVFISSDECYCKEIFDVRPMHYLLKPISSDILIKDIEKAIELLERGEHSFYYKQGKAIYKKAINEILYFEANGRKVRMVSTDEIVYFYDKINRLYSELEKYHFLLIHQSYLVNYNHIIEFGYNELKLTNSVCLPISRQRRKQVSDILLVNEERS